MSADPERFAFCQLDLPGAPPLAPGRYPIRPAAEGAEINRVLVITALGAALGSGRRRRRARAVDPEPEAALPLTRITVIGSEPLGDEAAARDWLARVRSDRERARELVAETLRITNRALHARRTATLDADLADVGIRAAVAIRAGYGDGDSVADGRWERAVELPRDVERERRADALRPEERIAAVLGGREAVAPHETLVVRARADLAAGRVREAAIGLDAALAAFAASDSSGGRTATEEEQEDLAAIEANASAVAAARAAALAGPLPAEQEAIVADTLKRCERVLRRRRIAG